MITVTNKELIEQAKQAMALAYAPYSKFKVGAAVLTSTGKVYTGCNIENASYGATNCAERTAIYKAVSEGEHVFDKIAIVSNSGDTTYPCGICRQVISEFMRKGELIFEIVDGGIKVIPIEQIFPYSFTQDDLLNQGEKHERNI